MTGWRETAAVIIDWFTSGLFVKYADVPGGVFTLANANDSVDCFQLTDGINKRQVFLRDHSSPQSIIET